MFIIITIIIIIIIIICTSNFLALIILHPETVKQMLQRATP